jgi:hypothetical protein
MIVGIDWLERFSPMKVHWAQKWLSIPYEGVVITLQGIRPDNGNCKLKELLYTVDDTETIMNEEIPGIIWQLLHQFENVFAKPSGLPPRRACDHKILLIIGASPVQARSYRYAPALKDEIEKQISK